MSEDEASIYESQLAAFEATVESESWKQDHDEAMACRDLERILEIGIFLYHWIERGDESWRLALARDELKYDERVDHRFDTLFDLWMRPCGRIEVAIQDLVAGGYDVDRGSEFLSCYQTAQMAKADR